MSSLPTAVKLDSFLRYSDAGSQLGLCSIPPLSAAADLGAGGVCERGGLGLPRTSPAHPGFSPPDAYSSGHTNQMMARTPVVPPHSTERHLKLPSAVGHIVPDPPRTHSASPLSHYSLLPSTLCSLQLCPVKPWDL